MEWPLWDWDSPDTCQEGGLCCTNSDMSGATVGGDLYKKRHTWFFLKSDWGVWGVNSSQLDMSMGKQTAGGQGLQIAWSRAPSFSVSKEGRLKLRLSLSRDCREARERTIVSTHRAESKLMNLDDPTCRNGAEFQPLRILHECLASYNFVLGVLNERSVENYLSSEEATSLRRESFSTAVSQRAQQG